MSVKCSSVRSRVSTAGGCERLATIAVRWGGSSASASRKAVCTGEAAAIWW